MSVDKVNVQPHGRILTVLGDIEFAPWQCLAELVDNAFDDFVANPNSSGRPTVTITLPGKRSEVSTAEVWIRDNGQGMDVETLANAVRAGWTGNARYGALGVYGMGFNIATARLGRLTTIKTSRVGDPSWTILTLDLTALAKGHEYDVPVRYEPKDNPNEHGTEIRISQLKRDQLDLLIRQTNKIRDKLGDIYGYLLREHNFLVTVNGTKLPVRRPCTWDPSRSVVRYGVEIPAVMTINHSLAAMKACQACGAWSPVDTEECRECRSTDLLERERRIWGWIGIQRFQHPDLYGIDFIRNGRKILPRSKQLFSWEDPDELEPGFDEYPIDDKRSRHGRIIGEIHCDHVPVKYQKHAFEYDSSEWKQVVRAIRGTSPLGPEQARRRGLPVNDSPLARLYSGYRRTVEAGLKNLVPGDGKRPIHEKTFEWAAKFWDGASDYQDDTIWYEAAYRHDNPIIDPEKRSDDPFDEMGLGGDADGTDAAGAEDDDHATDVTTAAAQPNGPESLETETLDERLSRYKNTASQLVDLSGRYEAADLGHIELTAWAVNETNLIDRTDNLVPIFTDLVRAPRLDVYIAARNPLFSEFGFDMRDLAIVEVAEFLRVRTKVGSGQMRPLAAVLADIKSRMPDQKVTADALATRARTLLDRIREAMYREIKGAPSGYWDMLQEPERQHAQRGFVLEGGDITWGSALESGEFSLYLPGSAVVHLLEKRPDSFLDGKVFRRPYANLADAGLQSLVVSLLIGLVSDLALLEEHHPRLSLDELQRVKLSCLLVERELADNK